MSAVATSMVDMNCSGEATAPFSSAFASMVQIWMAPVTIAQALRGRIREALGLTASVGVARVKLLAKLASEAAKPKASLKGPVPGRGVVVIGRAADNGVDVFFDMHNRMQILAVAIEIPNEGSEPALEIERRLAVATLVVAIASFYFGTKSAQQGARNDS